MTDEMRSKRESELAKYELIYDIDPNYRMGSARMRDAFDDVQWAHDSGCRSLLDIGCGRCEVITKAQQIGFSDVMGVEQVSDLCDRPNVHNLAIHELNVISAESVDLVTSFDVIEHLVRPDDELLVAEMARIARTAIVITANNRDSICRKTGHQLHINKRPYGEWDQFFRDLLEPTFDVTWMRNKTYVSETWRAVRR